MENGREIITPEKPETKISEYIQIINHANELLSKKSETVKKIRFNELLPLHREHPMNELAGVCIDGVHYYDFKKIHSINYTEIASLIDLLKCLLKEGVKIQFVNVNETIKNKIYSMGLEDILICS